MKAFVIVVLGLSPIFTFAQTETASTSTTSPQTVEVAPLQGIAVAEINLANAQMTETSSGTYTISFSLFNIGETQRGIHYVVTLSDTDGGAIMTQTFDKEVVLEKNQPRTISETFIAPKGLTGTYILHVRALTSAGLPVGSSPVGEIRLKDAELVRLTSCVPDQKEYSQDQILKVLCEVREIKKGALSSMENGGYVVSGKVFYGNDPKEVQGVLAEIQNGKATLEFRGLSDPGTYTIRTKITERGGAIVGKEQSNLFTVQGIKIVILNTLLHKDVYQSGDVALATVALKVASVGTTSPLTLSTNISGTKGACATEVKQEVGAKTAFQFEIPITTDCINPTLVTLVSDDKNTVLASSTVSYQSPVREDALKQPSPSVTARDKMIYGGVGGLGLLIGLLSVYIARRRLVNNVTP